MLREELMQLKNTELKVMCKERNLPVYKGKNALNKTEMVDSILQYDQENSAEQEQIIPVEESEDDERPTKAAERKDYHKSLTHPLIPSSKCKELRNTINKSKYTLEHPWVIGNHDNVISEAAAGTLIAFLDDFGKPRTAKLIGRKEHARKIKVETIYNRVYVVSYDNVLWVKTGPKWPRPVYNMLKGYEYGQPVFVTREAEKN